MCCALRTRMDGAGELVDNALRATKTNGPEHGRVITVSLLTDERGNRGCVCVRDNGCGMAVRELADWAVMNLAIEDRAGQQAHAHDDEPGASIAKGECK